jgi:hypothetical protein
MSGLEGASDLDLAQNREQSRGGDPCNDTHGNFEARNPGVL